MENTKPNNPSAFPLEYEDGDFQRGMTLRDYFANSAMQSIITNEVLRKALDNNTTTGEEMYNSVAKIAYESADAMLKQREI